MIFSLILQTACRVLIPVMLLFSAFLLLRGHHAPGGGFSGGLVAAGALSLYAIAYGVDEARQTLRRLDPRRLLGLGLALALTSGLLGLVPGQAFLEGLWVTLPLPLGEPLSLGTPLLFDLGVFFVVIGVVLTIIFVLEDAYTRVLSSPK